MVLYLHKIPLDETDPGADQSASALEPPASAEAAISGEVPALGGPARIVRAVRGVTRPNPSGYVGSPTPEEVRAMEQTVRLNAAAEKRRRETAAQPGTRKPPTLSADQC